MQLIGRSNEINHLTAAARRAAAGEPQVVVVRGEAGIGKSRLVDHFADVATRSGVVVLWGACLELGSHGLPRAALISILRQMWERWPLERLNALLPGSEMLRQIVPELAVGRPEVADQARLYSILAALLRRLSAESPLLLVVEDLHWADQSTRDLLSMLAHETRNARVQIIVTVRSDEHTVTHPVQLFLAEFSRLDRVSRLDLARLTKEESQQLIAALLGRPPPPAVVDEIFELSGGNAFFIEELTYGQANLGGSANRSLHDVLIGPVRRLDERAQQIVHTLAVGGRSVSHQLIAAVADMPEEALSHAIKNAVDGHVLIADATRYEFRHALVREAVLDSIVPAETIPLHRRYAEVLQRRPQLIGLDRAQAAIARHWCCADDAERAFPALLCAAKLAQTTSAPAERLGLLQHALDILPRLADVPHDPGSTRLDLLESAAIAARDSARFHLAASLIDEALGLVDQEREPDRAGRLLAFRCALLLHLSWGLEGHQALAMARSAERLVGTDVTAGRGVVLLTLAEALLYTGSAAQALEASEEAIRVARHPGRYRLSTAAHTIHALAQARLGAPKEAIDELYETRAKADEHRDLAVVHRVDISICQLLRSAAGDCHETIIAARRGQETAASAGLARTRGMVTAAYLAGALFDAGQWDEAEDTIRQALDLAPDALHAAAPHLSAAIIAIGKGDADAARTHLRNVEAGLEHAEHPHPLVAHVSAMLALREQRVDEARLVVSQALGIARSRADVRTTWTLLITAAQVETHAQLLSLPPAISLTTSSNTEVIRKIAAELPSNSPIWRACATQVESELESSPTPSARWREVVDAWDITGSVYNACYARFRAAEAAATRQNRTEARQLLQTAAEQAERLGAKWLRQDIDQLAQRARLPLRPGGSSRTSQPTTFHLTQREVEVLQLLAEGLTNRQIASQLVIAPKTVSIHVSRILTKLGASTRGQAAATAHRLRLFAGLGERSSQN